MKTPLLDALIKAMEQVEAAKKPLHMGELFRNNQRIGEIALDLHDNKEEPTLHDCGTAACIVGYGAFDADVRKMVGVESLADRRVGFPEETPYDVRERYARIMQRDARIVWQALEHEVGNHTCASIVNGSASSRRVALSTAVKDGEIEVPKYWYRRFDHLNLATDFNDDEDEPASAIEYMKAVQQVARSGGVVVK